MRYLIFNNTISYWPTTINIAYGGKSFLLIQKNFAYGYIERFVRLVEFVNSFMTHNGFRVHMNDDFWSREGLQ